MSHTLSLPHQLTGSCVLRKPLRHAHVINLERQPERWLATRRALRYANITECRRFPALDGSRLRLQRNRLLADHIHERRGQRRRDHRDVVTPGTVGCFLSHLALWRTLARNDPAHFELIFEDDAVPTPAYLDLSATARACALARVPGGADVILLGSSHLHVAAHTSCPGIVRVFYFTGLFAYLISPRAMRALPVRMTPMVTHVDHQLSDLLMSHPGEFSAYAVTPAWFDYRRDFACDLHGAVDERAANHHLARHVEFATTQLVNMPVILRPDTMPEEGLAH